MLPTAPSHFCQVRTRPNACQACDKKGGRTQDAAPNVKDSEWRTPRDGGIPRKEQHECENFQNCQTRIKEGDTTMLGPNEKRLCYACGMRYWRELKKLGGREKGTKKIGEEWRNPHSGKTFERVDDRDTDEMTDEEEDEVGGDQDGQREDGQPEDVPRCKVCRTK